MERAGRHAADKPLRSSMNVKQQKVGAGHIFCVADSFDDISTKTMGCTLCTDSIGMIRRLLHPMPVLARCCKLDWIAAGTATRTNRIRFDEN